MVILSPPCSTFSRARYRSRPDGFGPRPLRSRFHTFGFPWLSALHRALVQEHNFFVEQCAAMIQLMSALGHFWLLEHPEDLGRLPNGDDPASIWQWPQIRTAVGDAPCWGLRQCDYSADTPKPTRHALERILCPGNVNPGSKSSFPTVTTSTQQTCALSGDCGNEWADQKQRLAVGSKTSLSSSASSKSDMSATPKLPGGPKPEGEEKTQAAGAGLATGASL